MQESVQNDVVSVKKTEDFRIYVNKENNRVDLIYKNNHTNQTFDYVFSQNLLLEPVQRPFISFKFHNERKALYKRLEMEEQSAKKQAEPNSPALQAETVIHSTMTANEIL